METPPAPLTLEAALSVGGDEAREYCPGCHEQRPLSAFLDSKGGFDPEDPPLVCRRCQENGIPPKDPIALAPRERVILRCILEAPTFASGVRKAAAATGATENAIRKMLDGRRSNELRRAFQLTLELAGLDVHSIARGIVLASRAVEPKWNPKAERWDYFPDHKTRLAAQRHATRLQELEPPRERAGGGGGATAVAAVFVTNVGSGQGGRRGAYTAVAGPEPPELPGGE